MAVTVSSIRDIGLQSDLNYRVKAARVTLDNSYPTGGWPVTAVALGMISEVFRMVANPVYGHPLECVVQSDGSIKILAYANAGDACFIPVSLMALREATNFDVSNIAANGGLLASDTTPVLDAINDATDGCQRVTWASSNNDQVVFQVPLPPDLDTDKDIVLHFRIKSAGTTNAVGFTVDSFFNEGDTKVVDTSETNQTATWAEKIATIAAADVPAGAQTLTVGLTPVAHTTDALYLSAVWAECYRLVELENASARLSGKIVDAVVVGY